MYKLSLTQKIEQKITPKLTTTKSPNIRVRWCVHHVPKTAGSSLRQSFVNTFGKKVVFGVYRNTGAELLGKGEPIWIPKSAGVVFGHFATHTNHTDMFPNARSITWVREPLERVWSLLGHYLALGEQAPQYNKIKKQYIDRGIVKREAILEHILKDKVFRRSINVYSHYFKDIPLSQFDFVGSLSRNSDDLKRLQQLLGKPLTESKVNIRSSVSSFPRSLRYLEKELESEYEIVSDYL